MKILHSIFRNRWLRLALLVIFFQQALVAAGTYLMGELAAQAVTQNLDPQFALLLFLCVALPGSVIHYASVWFSTRAEKSVLLSYFQQYFAANFSQPSHWRNEESRRARHDVMSRSGQDAIQSTIQFAVDAAATLLNIALNTLSVILITDRILGAAILLAGFLGLWIVHGADGKISEASRSVMLSDNEVNAHLGRSWDNIVLGNALFFNRWKGRFANLFSASTAAAFNSVRQRDRIVATAGFFTTSIVLVAALLLAFVNRNDRALVVALLVMLPRSLQIVMHIQVIQNYLAQWKTLREKLVITEKTLTVPAPLELSGFVQKERIRIQSSTARTEELDRILGNGIGRYTVVGPNGAGKSAFLLELKARLGDRATYIPSHHQLELVEAAKSLSSGQIAMSVLEDVARSGSQVLLIDEWDANLSNENLSTQNAMIDRLSQERLIIEVRHLRA